MNVAALLVSVGFGLIVATVIQLEMNRPKVDVDDWYAYIDRVYRETKADDRAWARRSNTDTGLIRPYLAEARDQKRGTSCLLYTSPSPRDKRQSRMPSSA